MSFSALQTTARSVAANAGDPDEFADLLVELAPEVNDFLDECTPPDDIPDNPNPAANAAEEKAWVDACSLKSFAGDATIKHVRGMARRIKQKKRRSGSPVSHAEALALAHGLVDHATDTPLEEMAAALLESRQG